MSLLDSALDRLEEMIVETWIRPRDPFRAIVTGTADGMVTIRRLESATGETEQRARVPGGPLAVGDEVLCLPVSGKPVVLGRVQRAVGMADTVPKRLESSQSTTSATATTITGFSFPVAAGEVWAYDVYLRTVGNTGGIKYARTAPAGTYSQITTGSLASLSTTPGASAVTGSGTLTSAFGTGVYVGWAELHGTIAASASGTVEIQFAAGTGGESVSVEVGSYLVARRIS